MERNKKEGKGRERDLGNLASELSHSPADCLLGARVPAEANAQSNKRITV